MRRYNTEPIPTKAGLKTVRPATALALVIAACSVFEPPLAFDGDASAGSSGAAGAAGATGARGGSGGALGASGQSGSTGSGGSSGRGGSGGSSGNSGSSGSSGSSGADAGDGSAGTGGALPLGPWWHRTTTEGCESEGTPSRADRPNVPDGPSIEPITLAMDRIRIGAADDDANLTFNADAWRRIGFDFDSSCTGSVSCTMADAPVQDRSCAEDPQADVSDGDNCRDNALGSLFPIAAQSGTVGGWFGVTEANWNCALHRGEVGLLFRITEYNGQPYDPSVRLDLYTSTGTRILPAWSCVKSDYTVDPVWPTQAPWLATRHWYVSRRSIALNAPASGNELPIARFADPAAFVRGGYLFAALPPGTEIWMNGERSHVRPLRTVLQRAIMVGRLVRTGNTWVLEDATVQGAVLPSDEVQSFREIGFCQNMCGSYDALIGFFNIVQDVLSSTSDKLPNTRCDALSIAFSLHARSATADINDVVDAEPPIECPQPKHPLAFRQGCVCQPDGTCVMPDAGGPSDGGGG